MEIKNLFRDLRKKSKYSQIIKLKTFCYSLRKNYLNYPRNFVTLYYTYLNNYHNLLIKPLYSFLSSSKRKQLKDYDKLKYKFSSYYQEMRNYNLDLFLIPFWQKSNKIFEEYFLEIPPFSFLRNLTLRSIMFVSNGGKWLKIQIKYLEKKVLKKKLKVILLEDYIGNPILSNSKYITSHNSIHHLYHLIRFFDKTECNINEINTVIEWGGGYGNLAKIFQRIKEKSITYIIIDLPLFCCIQWLYLTTIFGEENINLINNSNISIIANKINLLPVIFIKKIHLKADLFISTWALTESSEYSQDYVLKNEFFNSKHILLSYSYDSKDFTNLKRFENFFINNNGYIEDIKYILHGGCRYAFK